MRWRLLWTAVKLLSTIYMCVRKEKNNSKKLVILLLYCCGDLVSKNLTIINWLILWYWMGARLDMIKSIRITWLATELDSPKTEFLTYLSIHLIFWPYLEQKRSIWAGQGQKDKEAEFGSCAAATTFFFLSPVCLALLLLAVLEHLSVYMQSPRETIEKILFSLMETESTSDVSLAFAHLMRGSSHSLSISYWWMRGLACGTEICNHRFDPRSPVCKDKCR